MRYLLAGLLSAVTDLDVSVSDSIVHLSWSAPFTLDIAGVQPDISYCVEAITSTNSSLTTHCDITTTRFSSPLPPGSGCNGYTFTVTVTPVNVVGNGTVSRLNSSDTLERKY